MHKAVSLSLLLFIILTNITPTTAQTSEPSNTAIASITLKQPISVEEAIQLVNRYELTPLMVEGDFSIGDEQLHDFFIIPPHTDSTIIKNSYIKQRLAFFVDISAAVDNAPSPSEKHSSELQSKMENQATAAKSIVNQQGILDVFVSKITLRGNSRSINKIVIDRPEEAITITDERSIPKTKPQNEQKPGTTVSSPNAIGISDNSRWNPEVGVSYVYPSQNGGRYSTQWMWWDEIPFSSEQTYEHDFFLYNYDNDGTYLNGNDTGYPGCFPVVEYAATTWPAESKPYLDTRFAANYVSCERDEMAYTIGAAQADKLTANTWHYTYIRTTDGNSGNDKFKLSAQLGHRTPSWCYTTWCSFGDDSRVLVPAWSSFVPGTRWWWARTASSCPGVYLAQYYNNRSLEGTPKFSRCEGPVNKNWGYSGPSYDVEPDNFSARWEGAFNFADDEYTFTAYVDDGVRVWIDDSLVLDKWFDQAATQYKFNHRMSAGNHKVKIEYFENGGLAIAQVRWQRYVSTQPIIVDEMSPGFTKGGIYWWDDWSRGINNHMYWTCANGNTVDSWAEWRPNLLVTGNYQVIVFIPNYHTNTTSAKYEIHHQYGVTTVALSQAPYYDQWVSLGTYAFVSDSSTYVRLTDATGEAPSCGIHIGFDAIAWIPK